VCSKDTGTGSRWIGVKDDANRDTSYPGVMNIGSR
jgi:hypothetical protein